MGEHAAEIAGSEPALRVPGLHVRHRDAGERRRDVVVQGLGREVAEVEQRPYPLGSVARMILRMFVAMRGTPPWSLQSHKSQADPDRLIDALQGLAIDPAGPLNERHGATEVRERPAFRSAGRQIMDWVERKPHRGGNRSHDGDFAEAVRQVSPRLGQPAFAVA